MPYVRYKHHQKVVVVRSDLKGKHREYCLCWNCDFFFPDDREKNCITANDVYQNCVEWDIVTPVWECPMFRRKRVEDEQQ